MASLIGVAPQKNQQTTGSLAFPAATVLCNTRLAQRGFSLRDSFSVESV